MNQIVIRSAKQADAACVARLFCADFAPQVGQFMIYGCKGATTYIANQITAGAKVSKSVYYVAQDADRIVAALELCRGPQMLHLNYIGVEAAQQGKRIGSRLLCEAIRLSGIGVGKFSLDVFDDNPRAMNWYQHLGLKVQQSSDIVEVRTVGKTMDNAAFLADIPQADLCQACFGFSKFTLVTARQSYTIGRIGDDWYRLNDQNGVDDSDLFRALSVLDPHRRIFLIAPRCSIPEQNIAQWFIQVHRMHADIAQVINKLQG